MGFAKIRNLFGITEDQGFSDEDLAVLIEQFGAIPKVLRDYYTELGAVPELNQTQDALVTPDTDNTGYYHFSRFSEVGEYLVFYSENQGVTLWGISAADVRLDDPPVWACQPISDDDYGEWYNTEDTVSQFLLAMSHMQRTLSYEYSSEENWDLTEEQASQVRERYPSHNADAQLYDGMGFYGRDVNEVIMLNQGDDRTYMWFGADNKERFEELWDELLEIVLYQKLVTFSTGETNP